MTKKTELSKNYFDTQRSYFEIVMEICAVDEQIERIESGFADNVISLSEFMIGLGAAQADRERLIAKQQLAYRALYLLGRKIKGAK